MLFRSNQRYFYEAMGGDPEDWSPKMREKIAAITAGAPTFRSFIAGGVKHVVLPYPEFYSYQAGGVRVRDWIADIADGKPVDDVDCGSNCAEAELYQR